MRNPDDPLRDHTGEMRSHHGPSDEAIEALLDGTPSQELAGTPLADIVERIRMDAATTEPTPSTELASLMAHGLAPTEKGDLPATAGSNATAPEGAWLPKWTRSAAMFRKLIIAKLAALGVVVKAGAAGAAVAVTAAGVGVTGQLPPPAQDAFDRIVQQDDAEEDEGDELEVLDEDDSLEVDDSVEADDTDYAGGPPEGSFGERVSQDATGESDGEPGVDGQEISAEARERAEQRREERRGEGAADADDLSDDDLSDDDVSDDVSDDDTDDEDDTDDDGAGGPPSDVPPVETPAGPPAGGQG